MAGSTMTRGIFSGDRLGLLWAIREKEQEEPQGQVPEAEKRKDSGIWARVRAWWDRVW